MDVDKGTDMDVNNVEDTRGCIGAHFASESHGTDKVKSIFKKTLSRSTSRSGFNGSDKLTSLMRFLREATKMTWDFNVRLPSDKSWRMKNYFKLLAKQKEKKITLHSMPSQESDVSSNWDPALLAPPELKRAKLSGSLSVSSEGSIPTCYSSDISWNSLDIAKAGSILEANSSANVSFHDEEEMRRVFTLLYDVFRYKHILNEALVETRFFQKYPEHGTSPALVWLLFYDLHKRRFLPREHAETVASSESFDFIGLTPIDRDLWNSKVKLAASLARNRIKNNALRLNQLLPNHLRDERLVSSEDSPMTGWINTFRMSKKEVCESIEKFGLKLQSKHETVLTKNDFRFDHLCPKLLLCHPIQRAELAQSTLVKNHRVVIQDRAFCIGPAIIAKILSEVPLRGTVAQTHVNSPRTTAYLANILADNDRLDKMIAFGAGDKLLEYQTYLHELGVNNCEIYAQKFTEIHPEAAVLENLVAIFATPPNSCTGVTDPVDLICSRGGDMCMLKALTQNELTDESCIFLEEQRETLEYSMSLPQVQIVLYETHSTAPEENLEMVTKIINKMNDFAKEKHEEDHRLLLEQEEAEERMNKPIGIPGMSREKEKEQEEVKDAQEREVIIPPCDLFELVALPDLCSHGSECLSDEGCYIARIQRKEIISLDAKYMIKIAEARGLFGNELGQKKPIAVRTQKKREDPANQSSASNKVKSRKVKVEIERITAPTQSSLYRARKVESGISGLTDCPRHQFHALESANKVEVFSARTASGAVKRKTRTRKCQEESVRRLSRPNMRWSSSPSNLLSEVRPSFWRYATAKSVEDLIRALRKKRRAKRSFRLDDNLILSKSNNQQESFHLQPAKATNTLNEEEIPGLQINFFGKKYMYPFRTPFMSTKRTLSSTPVKFFDDCIEDIIKVVNRVKISSELLNIGKRVRKNDDDGDKEIAPGSSLKTLLAPTSNNDSSLDASIRDPSCCMLLHQCFDAANDVFDKIDNAIREEEEKIRNTGSVPNQAKVSSEKASIKKGSPRKETRKLYKQLQKLTETEVPMLNPMKIYDEKDIILHEKYLPGQQTTVDDKKFIRLLHTKLSKLQRGAPSAMEFKNDRAKSSTMKLTRRTRNVDNSSFRDRE